MPKGSKMSKAKQRKQSAYDQGYKDYKTGYGFRWSRHQFMGAYTAGHQLALRESKNKRPFKNWIISKLNKLGLWPKGLKNG